MLTWKRKKEINKCFYYLTPCNYDKRHTTQNGAQFIQSIKSSLVGGRINTSLLRDNFSVMRERVLINWFLSMRKEKRKMIKRNKREKENFGDKWRQSFPDLLSIIPCQRYTPLEDAEVTSGRHVGLLFLQSFLNFLLSKPFSETFYT